MTRARFVVAGFVTLCLCAGATAALLVRAAQTRATQSVAMPCVYRDGGALPDPRCTPGATYAKVTQRTIRSTICVPGWTGTIRPPEAVTEPMKFASMRAYGDSTVAGQAARYEFDHLIPIELGGAPADPRNLWPEPRAGSDGSYSKDGVENHLRALVCAGQMKLAAARAIMRTDWRRGR